MNTANLQLQGLLAVLSSLLRKIEEKQVLSRGEIEQALDRAAEASASSVRQHPEISDANVEAACFPARYLRAALSHDSELFAEIAALVGHLKDHASAR